MATLSDTTAESAQEELDRAREIVADVTLPAEITSVDVSLGLDAYENQAIWLTYRVKPDVKADRSEVRKLTEFVRSVQSRLFDAGISLFPYTRLEQPE